MSDATADCNDLTTNYLSKRNETVSENCIDEDMHLSYTLLIMMILVILLLY